MSSPTKPVHRVRIDTIAEVRPGFDPRIPADERSTSPWRIALGRHAGENGRIDWTVLPPCEPARAIERCTLQDGDILVTTRTTNVRAIVVVDVPPQIVASAQFAILRPQPGRVNAHYLAWSLNRAEARGQLRALFKGSSIPFIPVADLAGFEIPLPPMTQQRALAHVLALRHRERELRQQLDHALEILMDSASRENPTRG